jgi:hypothetical protein
VILSSRAGRESFRHTIMANDQDHAIEKAMRMAKRMQVKLEFIAPEKPTLIAWQEAAMAADAVQARGSGGAA